MEHLCQPYVNRLSISNQLARVLWRAAYLLLFRPSPVILHGWRAFLLRCFGGRIERGARAYPRCRIWAPWNLTMGEHSCLADDVDCYCVAPIKLGRRATVSQYSYLCGASHDYESEEFTLVPRPITIGVLAWVAAGSFVAPGVTVGDGAVVGARSTVLNDVTPWTVVAGHPARFLKHRHLGTTHAN